MRIQTNHFKSSLLLLGLIISLKGVRVSAADFEVQAEHAIAIEVSTGKILYEKDAKTPDAIASISKLLTVYRVYQEVSQGNLTWETKVPISDYAYNLTKNLDVSNVPLEAREYTVKDLVNASLTASSNSATIALAEYISGSEPAFVDTMMAQLESWGITDARLVNASGLNNSFLGNHLYPNSTKDDENYMSAQSVAIMAHHLITEFPEVLEITSLPSVSFAGMSINSYNYLLETYPYYRKGVTGLKTGTSEKAGASLVTTSTENGMEVISVILNAKHSNKDTNSRFLAANALLDYVAANFQLSTLISKGQAFDNSRANITDGREESVLAVASQDFNVVTSTKKQISNATFTQIRLTAPIYAGISVGTLTYQDPNPVGDGYIDAPPATELVSAKAVKRDSFLKIQWNHFSSYINDKLSDLMISKNLKLW